MHDSWAESIDGIAWDSRSAKSRRYRLSIAESFTLYRIPAIPETEKLETSIESCSPEMLSQLTSSPKAHQLIITKLGVINFCSDIDLRAFSSTRELSIRHLSDQDSAWCISQNQPLEVLTLTTTANNLTRLSKPIAARTVILDLRQSDLHFDLSSKFTDVESLCVRRVRSPLTVDLKGFPKVHRLEIDTVPSGSIISPSPRILTKLSIGCHDVTLSPEIGVRHLVCASLTVGLSMLLLVGCDI